MLSTRTDFLKPATRRYKNVTLPVSGNLCRIRSLMEGEKEAYEAATLSASGGVRKDRLENARRRLIVLCLVDDNGDPLLTAGDLDTLKTLDGADMATLQNEIMEHVGFKPGDIEGLVKNSDGGRADSSG